MERPRLTASYEPAGSRLENKDSILALIHYGDKPYSDSDIPVVNVNMAQLGDTALNEIWRSTSPVTEGSSGNISFRANGDILFGIWQPSQNRDNLQQEAAEAYLAIRSFVSESSYPNLLRVWNYMSSINKEEQGLERYRSFCLGRYDAVMHNGFCSKESLPAASALGSESGGLVIYFIASKEPGRAVENPRQISAYNYPEQYGPRSPSFSRAMDCGQDCFFISGTASIKGHETKYAGNTEKQFQETVLNINTLITDYQKQITSINDLSLLKVYIRNSDDYPLVSNLVSLAAADVPVMYLKADICRSDLLLEIEGLYLSAF